MTQTPRRAEIAGAGIAGLTAACVLAHRGWQVRIHERTSELREMGAGIYLKLNSLLVLKQIGALEDVRRAGRRLRVGEIRNEADRVLVRREISEDEEAITILRGELHRVLAETAVRLGVQVATNSAVKSADSSGRLVMESGEVLEADLVIGADGYRSGIRDSLGLTENLIPLSDGATRVLAPRIGDEREGYTAEYWAGDCRAGVVPCSQDQLYLYLIGPEDNPRARALPLDKAFWSERFPQIAEIIQRIPPEAGRHDQLHLGKVRGWVSGRVGIIGDAAHAQPPNLGQGAGMAMANAGALGAILDREPDVPTALLAWERERRGLSEDVQMWSHRYGLVCKGAIANWHWPRTLLFMLITRLGFASRKWGYLWRGGYHAGEASTFKT
jgi:2-polyprenyl-6-methoxyphenol hydroxylase-like FAD-dependent oxidoreductase